MHARAFVGGLDARHLVKSLRVKSGDRMDICDSLGTVYRARVDGVTVDSVTLSIESSRYEPPERPQIVMFQAISKNAAMDEAVARAAEAGASRMVPFTARRSPFEAMKKGVSRTTRWRAIARESSMLARRPYPLEVRDAASSFDEAMMGTVGDCVVLWEEEKKMSLADALPARAPRSVGLVIGPEGGLEAAEVDVMRSMGARSASMGSLNLRAQSAGAFAAMMIRNQYGLLAPLGSGDE